MSKKLIFKILFTLVTMLAIPMESHAQEAPYKFDIGGGIGMSGYLGDVNESNPFKSPGIAASGTFRYIIDSRWALRGLLSVATLSGDSENSKIVFPEGRTYNFKSTVYDLGCRAEFNFFPYGIGETYKRLRRWSPYLAVGLGGTVASARDGGTSVAFNVPMAVGVKFKMKERLNLAVEFSMTKVFGDKVDGPLTDLYQINSSFAKNTDWYSVLSVSLTYEFGKRCETCNRID